MANQPLFLSSLLRLFIVVFVHFHLSSCLLHACCAPSLCLRGVSSVACDSLLDLDVTVTHTATHTVHYQYGVHFTFDDGPSATHGQQLLDVLKRYNITATFFVVGANLKQINTNETEAEVVSRGFSRSVVARLLREGHFLGQHTMTHRSFYDVENKANELQNDTFRQQYYKEEIESVEHLLVNLTGSRPFLFRAPFGLGSPSLSSYLREHSYIDFGWTQDSSDWALNGHLQFQHKARQMAATASGRSIPSNRTRQRRESWLQHLAMLKAGEMTIAEFERFEQWENAEWMVPHCPECVDANSDVTNPFHWYISFHRYDCALFHEQASTIEHIEMMIQTYMAHNVSFMSTPQMMHTSQRRWMMHQMNCTHAHIVESEQFRTLYSKQCLQLANTDFVEMLSESFHIYTDQQRMQHHITHTQAQLSTESTHSNSPSVDSSLSDPLVDVSDHTAHPTSFAEHDNPLLVAWRHKL